MAGIAQPFAAPTAPRALNVSQLTALIKGELEGNFFDVWVEGELSGVKLATSGHCYFTLKDANAQLSCTLFRPKLSRIRFRLQDGMKVLIRGSISVYEPRGTYSLNVQEIEPKGAGDLQLAFEQLKARLAAEGLFDKGRKRPIPYLCQRIGLVTSPTGAALHDLLTVMRRRNPQLHIVLSPSVVQGATAGPDIARAIARLNALGNLDVIIVGRGGGSYEDLFCFNDEAVARAIAASRIPVVSAVGHEVDVTIADFVADLRAPTPSAAAELVVRERAELLDSLEVLESRLALAMQKLLQRRQTQVMGLSERLRDPQRRILEAKRRVQALDQRLEGVLKQRLALASNRLGALQTRLLSRSPAQRLAGERRSLIGLRERLVVAVQRSSRSKGRRLSELVAHLQAVSPLSILARGYSVARIEGSGQLLRSVEQVALGEHVRLKLQLGELTCEVVGKDGAASDPSE